MAGVDEAVFALVAGLVAYLMIEAAPKPWMRAAGGLLIALTVGITALQLLGLA